MQNKSIERRAIEWLLSDDTGTSSKALCAHMLGTKSRWLSPPSDADDRGRCVRLLQLIPEWQPRLNEMAAYKSAESLVFSSGGMATEHNGWAEQIPLIKQMLPDPPDRVQPDGGAEG